MLCDGCTYTHTHTHTHTHSPFTTLVINVPMQACQEAPDGDYSCGSISTGQFIYENGKAYLYYVDGDDDRYISWYNRHKTFVKVNQAILLCIVMECILHLNLVKDPERISFRCYTGDMLLSVVNSLLVSMFPECHVTNSDIAAMLSLTM